MIDTKAAQPDGSEHPSAPPPSYPGQDGSTGPSSYPQQPPHVDSGYPPFNAQGQYNAGPRGPQYDQHAQWMGEQYRNQSAPPFSLIVCTTPDPSLFSDGPLRARRSRRHNKLRSLWYHLCNSVIPDRPDLFMVCIVSFCRLGQHSRHVCVVSTQRRSAQGVGCA